MTCRWLLVQLRYSRCRLFDGMAVLGCALRMHAPSMDREAIHFVLRSPVPTQGLLRRAILTMRGPPAASKRFLTATTAAAVRCKVPGFRAASGGPRPLSPARSPVPGSTSFAKLGNTDHWVSPSPSTERAIGLKQPPIYANRSRLGGCLGTWHTCTCPNTLGFPCH